MPSLKDIASKVNDQDNKQRIHDDHIRFMMYNGMLKSIIEKAIEREFQVPETVQQLKHRIIPINFLKKIIDKSSTVYLSPAIRSSTNMKPSDELLIAQYEDSMNMNVKMKMANRYFNLMKHVAYEPFVDRYGVPRLRIMPSHSYSLYSDDSVQPERMTHFIKHLKFGTTSTDTRLGIWTDENYWITDGEGNYLRQEQEQFTGNPEPINPYGKIPFIFNSESNDVTLLPISDDDIKSIQVAIGVILSDQSFISKFQTFSAIAISGSEPDESFTMSPNAVWKIPENGDIKVIKPDANIAEMMSFVKELVIMLLSTKNLKTTDIKSGATDDLSGIAKAIDEATTTSESRSDQQDYFLDSEKELWELLHRNMIPFWINNDMVNPDFRKNFSDSFEIAIQYTEPKSSLSMMQLIDVQEKLLNLGLQTKRRALMEIYPTKTDDEIDEIIRDVNEEMNQLIRGTRSLDAGNTEDV